MFFATFGKIENVSAFFEIFATLAGDLCSQMYGVANFPSSSSSSYSRSPKSTIPPLFPSPIRCYFYSSHGIVRELRAVSGVSKEDLHDFEFGRRHSSLLCTCENLAPNLIKFFEEKKFVNCSFFFVIFFCSIIVIKVISTKVLNVRENGVFVYQKITIFSSLLSKFKFFHLLIYLERIFFIL